VALAAANSMAAAVSGQQMVSFVADSCFCSGHGAWLTPLWKMKRSKLRSQDCRPVIRPHSSSMKNACLLAEIRARKNRLQFTELVVATWEKPGNLSSTALRLSLSPRPEGAEAMSINQEECYSFLACVLCQVLSHSVS